MVHRSAEIRLSIRITFAFFVWNVLCSSPCARVLADDLRVVRSVEYAIYDQRDAKGNLTGKKRKLLADIYLPSASTTKAETNYDPEKDKNTTLYPTVLMVHGGAWFSGNKAHVTLHARDVAAVGFAVVAVNYRLAPHYKFPAQLEDLRSALQFIQSNAEKYSFDTERILSLIHI